MKKCNLSYLLAALALLSCSVFALEEPAPGCETVANVQGICGFPAPEDIDVFPGGKYLLFSPIVAFDPMGGMGSEEGQSLYLFDLTSLTASPINYLRDHSDKAWGESSCDTAPGQKFSPHGVHISRRADGSWQVLAVNHVRESVEMFEVIEGEGPSLAWRGCVITPPKSNINDLVALPDGGLLVTHMVDRGTMDVMAAMQATQNTGYVWRWRPNKGFDKLPGSDGIVPNGIALSADGKSVFISETGGQRLRKLDYLTGKQLGLVSLGGPVDNLSWAADGSLIITRITGAMPEECFSKPGPCLTPFDVVAVDPDTLELTVLHEQRGKPMGQASVAVVVQGHIYIGSFKGDQILRVALPAKE
jgi:SMP-30/Gluconolactonase/LRE-like region